MKKIILLIFISWQACSQEKLIFETSYFGGIKPSEFSILPLNLLYKVTKNVGIGLNFISTRGNFGLEKEMYIAPRIEYTFGQLRLRPFVGLTYGNSTFEKNKIKEKKWEAKYVFGARFKLNKHLFLKAEASNYRYNSGLSIWPTLGLGASI